MGPQTMEDFAISIKGQLWFWKKKTTYSLKVQAPSNEPDKFN